MEMNKNQTADMLFVVILFSLYTFCALFLSVLGADVYRRNVEDAENNYSVRTSSLYLAEKIRQNETADAVHISTYNDSPALVLTQTINDKKVNIWIYLENGYLCEATLNEGVNLISGIGQRIVPVEEIEFDKNSDGLLKINVVEVSGSENSSVVFLECADGEVA